MQMSSISHRLLSLKERVLLNCVNLPCKNGFCYILISRWCSCCLFICTISVQGLSQGTTTYLPRCLSSKSDCFNPLLRCVGLLQCPDGMKSKFFTQKPRRLHSGFGKTYKVTKLTGNTRFLIQKRVLSHAKLLHQNAQNKFSLTPANLDQLDNN